MAGLRELKRENTRRMLVESADRLFRERGYAETTMADIGAAAGVSTRTVFAYFPTKDDLLFPDAEERIAAAVDAIESAREGEDPSTALVRALERADVVSTDLLSDRAALRLSLMRTEPSVQGRGLRLLADAQAAIGEALHRAHPDRYTAVQAAAVVGAFVGAASAAVYVVLATMPDATPDEQRDALRAAVQDALAPWVSSGRTPE